MPEDKNRNILEGDKNVEEATGMGEFTFWLLFSEEKHSCSVGWGDETSDGKIPLCGPSG